MRIIKAVVYMVNMEYREKIEHIKFKLKTGQQTYYEAKEEAAPIIEEMNLKGREIAKKYNQRYKPFTFSSLMR